jgi:hypothetical protein
MFPPVWIASFLVLYYRLFSSGSSSGGVTVLPMVSVNPGRWDRFCLPLHRTRIV